MLIGYARISPLEPLVCLDQQSQELQAAGCEVKREQVSDMCYRPVLETLLSDDVFSPGDFLVVTSLSRLARSVNHLHLILSRLEQAGAALRVLDINLDTSTPAGQQMLIMITAIARLENELLQERQSLWQAKARRSGTYAGQELERQASMVNELTDAGMAPADIAHSLRISLALVHRLLKDRKPERVSPA